MYIQYIYIYIYIWRERERGPSNGNKEGEKWEERNQRTWSGIISQFLPSSGDIHLKGTQLWHFCCVLVILRTWKIFGLLVGQSTSCYDISSYSYSQQQQKGLITFQFTWQELFPAMGSSGNKNTHRSKETLLCGP